MLKKTISYPHTVGRYFNYCLFVTIVSTESLKYIYRQTQIEKDVPMWYK